ncbi:MAG: ribosome biogenesis GTP-binding protein YihA/YsxC [Fretibacterium sp.]|nr:ribosome biogenesis GTP-binding protein YihA/YsxC [Fretibacterium sp.]
MKRVTVEATCFTPAQFPTEELPEIVVAGRSNVGKSSLINVLLGTKLAHVGGTPGKTRSINFYRVEDGDERPAFRLVDLPGYGYAARSKAEKKDWLRLISAYVEQRKALRLVCHLVDFRHGLLANDRELQEWFVQQGKQLLVVFTKADKLPKGQWRSRVQQYVREGLYSVDVPIVTSAEKRAGVEELQNFIVKFLTP